jgi:hypothetical protein
MKFTLRLVPSSCLHAVVLGLSLGAALAPSIAGAQTAARKKIVTETDLPRFTYPATIGAVDLVKADDATLKPLLDKYAADLDSVLNGYDIQDKATLRTLLGDKEIVQLLRGDLPGATATVELERALQDKPSSRQIFGLEEDPFLAAWKQTGKQTGPEFQKAYGPAFAAYLQTLTWPIVQEDIKGEKSSCEVVTASMVESSLKNMDTDTRKTGTMTFTQASRVLSERFFLKDILPL